jgi:hypothetical protein
LKVICKLSPSVFLFLVGFLLESVGFANGQQTPTTAPTNPVPLPRQEQPAVLLPRNLVAAKSPDPVLHDKLSHQVLGHAKRPIIAHTAFSGFWRTDGGFVAKMRIKNALVTGPLEVAPVLYMADGTEYQLPTATVATSGVISININQALAQAPASVITHLSSFGSASLTYRHASGGHLIASISMQDTSRSLVLSYPFTESPVSRRRSQSSPTVWEGVWWKHDAGVQGFLAVSNATGHEAQAKIRLISPSGALAGPKTIVLKAHSTQMLSLENTDGLGASGDAGGIRLEHSDEAGAIAVAGGLLNAKEGYSANIPFVELMSSPVGPVTLGSAGIMVGKPDAMMRFPSETTFTPYLVLRNATTKALSVTLFFSYMAEGGPVSKQTSENLPPLATKRVDLSNILQTLGLKEFSGSINIGASYTGLSTDLVMASGSVDQTGNYVFEVQPQALSPTHKKLGNYWDLDAGSNTMYSLWNPTDKPQAVVVTLHYDNGSGKYKIPVRVEPQSSVMLDLKNIIESNAPDADGNVFPASTSEGGATIESADGPTGQMNLIISGAVFNVVTGTCFGCCVPCCGISEVFMDPSSDACTVGDTQQFQAVEEDCQGGDTFTTGVTWSSSNTAVMTVNSSGLMSAVAPGSATLNFQSTLPASSDCGQPVPGECPLTNFPASAPVNVDDFTISDVQSINDGGTSNFSVTISPNSSAVTSYQWSFSVSGQGAGNSPKVTFSSPTAAQTNTDGHWFAQPNDPCTASSIASYTINAEVKFADGGDIIHDSGLIISVPWQPAGTVDGRKSDITGAPTIAQRPDGTWVVTGIGSLGRKVPTSVADPFFVTISVPPSSQFYNKTVQHEQVHVNQFIAGLGQLYGDLWDPQVFFGRISGFTASTQANLMTMINTDRLNYDTLEIGVYAQRLGQAEAEAHAVSDPIAPQYIYQTCP